MEESVILVGDGEGLVEESVILVGDGEGFSGGECDTFCWIK